MTTPSLKVALALGGGGARGLAHIGALEVLQDEGVPITSLVGVSVGSIAAAAFAFDPDAHKLRENGMRYLTSPEFRKYSTGVSANAKDRIAHSDHEGPHQNGNGNGSWFSKILDYLRANRAFHRMILGSSLLPGKILEEVVEAFVPDADIADAKVPLTIVAVDLITGREVEITRGPARRAVLGSASLPGIFPPVEYGGCLLADVGVISAVPCHAARRGGADRVIAIDVTMHPPRNKHFPSAVDVMLRLQDVASSLFLNLVLQQADVVIRPEVSHLQWTDFRTIPDTIERGRIAAHASMPAIRAAIGMPAAPPTVEPPTIGPAALAGV
jgi:NTE family protein